jgi:tetraacyldisaccharide 4'-kinase
MLFGFLIRLRLFFYQCGWKKQSRLPVPVIVVGNIFVGGTGKTPLTIWLLNQLKLAGYRPGVISRGYGSEHAAPRVVSAQSQATEVGDEPVLIAQQTGCPVVVSRKRVDAGLSLLAAFPDVNVIVSDDGLQHLALYRDVEIMLFDARGAGNGWLLPAGPLREPLSRHRDFTVANLNQGEAISSDLPNNTTRMQLNGSCARQLMHADQIRLFADMNSSLNLVAAAGIGNPERFFAMLRQHGLHFSALPLPDHYNYAINPFAHLSADMILITEKDAVKCRLLNEIATDPRIWVVGVEADLDAGLMEAILNKLH